MLVIMVLQGWCMWLINFSVYYPVFGNRFLARMSGATWVIVIAQGPNAIYISNEKREDIHYNENSHSVPYWPTLIDKWKIGFAVKLTTMDLNSWTPQKPSQYAEYEGLLCVKITTWPGFVHCTNESQSACNSVRGHYMTAPSGTRYSFWMLTVIFFFFLFYFVLFLSKPCIASNQAFHCVAFGKFCLPMDC